MPFFFSDEFEDIIKHTTLNREIPFNFNCDFIKHCFISSTATDFAARMSTTAMCDLHFSWSTTADNQKFEHPVINMHDYKE
jgi:hypothetical protein